MTATDRIAAAPIGRGVCEVPERIAHTHLEDVDAGYPRAVQEKQPTHTEAVRGGLYRPLGGSDVDSTDVVRGVLAA